MCTPAFTTPLTLSRPSVSRGSAGARRSICTRRVARMQATPEEDDKPLTSASEILRTLREESSTEREDVPRSMLGVYRDVDGKSNVWAVEPLEETDTKPQLSKTTLLAVAAGFIVVALLVLPLLPFTNADQI